MSARLPRAGDGLAEHPRSDESAFRRADGCASHPTDKQLGNNLPLNAATTRPDALPRASGPDDLLRFKQTRHPGGRKCGGRSRTEGGMTHETH